VTSTTDAASAAPSKRVRRYDHAGEASKDIQTCFEAWSSGLSSYGVQAAYAVIAANWAVHTQTNAILANDAAKWSMLVAIAFLGLHLGVLFLMTWLYRNRVNYIDDDKDRWGEEFDAAGKKKRDPWPHTKTIECVGSVKRWLLLLGPVTSCLLLIASLF